MEGQGGSNQIVLVGLCTAMVREDRFHPPHHSAVQDGSRCLRVDGVSFLKKSDILEWREREKGAVQ